MICVHDKVLFDQFCLEFYTILIKISLLPFYTVRHKILDQFKRLYLWRNKSDSNKILHIFRVYIEKVFTFVGHLVTQLIRYDDLNLAHYF